MLKINHDELKKQLKTRSGTVALYHLPALDDLKIGGAARRVDGLPYSIRVLLESALRNLDGFKVTEDDVIKILSWEPNPEVQSEIAFKPARVILQDFTGVPAVVDLAAMRSAMERMGKDYRKIDLQVPCDLVVDHSVVVDAFGSNAAFETNIEKEFERNRERYELLKWAQSAFKNLRVVPPGTGIIHQVNLEYLARGVFATPVGSETVAYPDSLVGTDSHTTMINGIGIVGWGVGGIEAEAVMLGEPINMLLPNVVGFRLHGRLREGVTATDLVLTVVEILRKKGVVGKFVEFFGEGLADMSLPDRATLANMAPEYGATMGYFPVDEETIRYYRLTGREEDQVELIESYMKEQGLFFTADAPVPEYSDTVELDLADVRPSLAGPRRPQDRVPMGDLKKSFRSVLARPAKEGGFGLAKADVSKTIEVKHNGGSTMGHGSTVIAAITSCTNTSNPSVMIAAGLLAKNAVERGLKAKDYVKTSLAPGSQVVTEYYRAAGLDQYLETLGFYTVGYGCTTCIGNSGPLPQSVESAIKEGDLVAASVLSGNRNFEGRVHQMVKANYLASPPLVIAYAIAGTVDIDLENEPLGKDKNGNDVFLKDVWPTQKEVDDVINRVVRAEAFREKYKNVFEGNEAWNKIQVTSSESYDWRSDNTYIQEPPFFARSGEAVRAIEPIQGARALVMLGDSVTTDHISPAGAIAPTSPAGEYLQSLGIQPLDFNSYGSRRGNHQVMLRGTFANIRLRNLLAPGTEGTWTTYFPENVQTSIYDASLRYQEVRTPLVVLAGKEYGSGSSRDWAAKGTSLLGVRAVMAESYERIHRSNLIGMGVLPLEFPEGQSWKTLNLKGDETFAIEGLSDQLEPRQMVRVTATSKDGATTEFDARVRIDTPVEVEYYRNGGILQTVLKRLAES
ncbi:MAG: aconitate hydratase AcnA [Candidatus Latescibacterota bacterium]|nr:MAG: aconitate hydratase AcnA [Candidatus Latescibacterota bacterium]